LFNFYISIYYIDNKYLLLQGARDVLRQFGYVVEIENGLAYQEEREPDRISVARLITDLYLAKRELEAYYGLYHPYPARLEKYIQQHAR
jgi:hypothetical protein